MANTHTVVCWVTVAIWLLIYVEGGRGKEISLDGLPLSNYTIEEVKVTTPRSLEGWYKITNGFLSAVHSKSNETIDLVIEYLNGKKIVWPNSVYELLKLQYAMFGCIVVGIVFAVIMILSGLIFFCCRMCGNCGGKRIQILTNRTSTWRKVLIFSLLVLTAVLLPAVIISFTINNSLKGSLNEAEKTVFSSLHDAEAFVNNTELQVASLVQQGLEKVVGGVSREVIDVKSSIEKKLMQVTTGMDTQLQQAHIALSGWHSLSAAMEGAREASKQIEDRTTNITNELSILKEELNSSLECSGANCEFKIDFTVFTLNEDAIVGSDEIAKVVESLNNSLQDLNLEEYNSITTDVAKAIKALPSNIAAKTLPIREVILFDLQNYKNEILNSEILKAFEKTANVTRKMLQKLHGQVEERFPDAHKYDKYRWYFGLSLFIVMAVVVVGLLLGLFCGICGYKNKKQATKRTALSNAGGLTLMFTVYWMFFFSVLLMLFTTSMFAVGGMIEAYVCKPAFEHEFTTLDKVMTAIQHKIVESNGASLIKYLKPSDALSVCANNGTVYAAFNLESLNISSLFDYRERLKIEQRKKELQDNSYPGPVMYNEHYDKLFLALIKALDFNTSFIDKLREKLMDEYEAKIQLISEVDDQNVKEVGNKLNLTVKNVESIEEARMNLSESFKAVEKLKNGVMQYKEFFRKTEVMMPGLIQHEIKEFVDELMKYSDYMIQLINENFETKLAPCRPLWNIFDASRTVLCKRYVQPLNGIWFATGWALFFYIPTIIVSTMLSKHLLRMKSAYPKEKEEKYGYDLEGVNGHQMKSISASYHF